MTYDITAWCLPSAFNLDAYAVTTPVAAAGWDAWKRPDAASLTPGIGWAVRGGSLAASDFVAQALAAGLPLRVADKPFAVEGVQFPRGSVVVLAADAPDRALLPEVQALVRQLGLVEVKTLSSGLSGAGVDRGSDALRGIQAPRVAMAWGNEVSARSAGAETAERTACRVVMTTGLRTGQVDCPARATRRADPSRCPAGARWARSRFDPAASWRSGGSGSR